MSPNPNNEQADRPGMPAAHQLSRYDDHVRDQFIWEVGETLELIRTVSMAGSRIDDLSADDIMGTCVNNLLELGEALRLEPFIEAVRGLNDVLRFDPFDAAMIDKNIDAVQQARWDWPTPDGA